MSRASIDLTDAVTAAHAHYARTRPVSAAADARARRVLPGGNTRSVLDFDPFPFRVASASGAEIVDVDGHRYIDFCGNYTAGLLGHSPERVRRAVTDRLAAGWTLGATHETEAELAELVCARFPSIEQVRFTNSGTEANLMAIGTALNHTGRTGVGVFDRAYHGGVLGFGPDPAGPHHPLNVPHRFVVTAFDDEASLDRLFGDDDLGCVLIEVLQGSGGCRPARPEFLRALRDRCDRHGVLLVFDEVMTSRLAPGGAQERFGVLPDITTLGKYLGGGFTFGAFGGRRDVMAGFDPRRGGLLSQAGTFNNNVVSMTGALATIRHELDDDRIIAVNDRGDRLRENLNRVFQQAERPLHVTGLGSMMTIHAERPDYLELLFHHLLDEGCYVARRGFIALSFEISDDDCSALIAAVEHWATSA